MNMNEDRIREILHSMVMGDTKLTDELIEEILLSENLKKDIHPLMALTITWLVEFWQDNNPKPGGLKE